MAHHDVSNAAGVALDPCVNGGEQPSGSVPEHSPPMSQLIGPFCPHLALPANKLQLLTCLGAACSVDRHLTGEV